MITGYGTFLEVYGWKDRRFHQHDLLIFVCWVRYNTFILHFAVDVELAFGELKI